MTTELERIEKNLTEMDKIGDDTTEIFDYEEVEQLPKRFKPNYKNFNAKKPQSQRLLRVSSAEKGQLFLLSPISEITLNLDDSRISTPRSTKLLKNKSDESKFVDQMMSKTFEDTSVCEDYDFINGQFPDSNDHQERKNIDFNDDDSSLISNNFTLNTADSSSGSGGGGSTFATRRMEARSRCLQRRLNIEMSQNELHCDEMTASPSKGRMSIDDVSFYDSSDRSPTRRSPRRPYPMSPSMDVGPLSPEGSPQRFTVVQNTVTMVEKRRSQDEIDGNSMDSGYGTSTFKFAEPQMPKKLEPSPPKRIHDILKLQTYSPKQVAVQRYISPPKSFRIFHSLSSGSTESMEDDYLELFEMEPLDDVENHLPSDLNSLIRGDIKTNKTTPDGKRPLVRRCLSLTDNTQAMQVRNALASPKTPEILKSLQDTSMLGTSLTPYSSRTPADRCFKRPEPLSISPIQSKRYKTEQDEKENALLNSRYQKMISASIQRPILRKSMSMNDAHIMTALARSVSEPALIGDFSKPFCLPLTEGRHSDLKSISCETMAKLVRNEFFDDVASFKIIDCRYPYEYEGGHIHGAQNMYTHDQILEALVNSKTEAPTVQAEGPKRHILVFHCEFSSERGPKLSRFLRNHDRLRNTNVYPALHYPEMYLLHGGYKEFYEKYSELCDPIAYRPMLDPSFGDAYKQFRAKSKSWNGDIKASAAPNRSVKSRSRLVL